MKTNLIMTLFFAAMCSLASVSEAGDIRATVTPAEAPKYSLVKIDAEMPFFSGNANDPEVVGVNALIKTPSGRDIKVPAFCLSNRHKDRKSRWEVRFAPPEEGVYSCRLEVKSRDINGESAALSFNVKGVRGEGFLRKSGNNPYYLVFDSGKPFFGIGHNVAWTKESSLPLFDRYFSEMQANGCNLTRVWICEWSFPLEWKKLGEYDPEVANKIDELVALAEKKGIYIMLCLGSYGDLMEGPGDWNEGKWDLSPYNKANGGPCASPESFFTDPSAVAAYKNKLRYVAARWGYSPNVFAVEFWNEYDAPAGWVKDMAAYLKSVDPHRQLVTTSNGYPYDNNFDESSVWTLDEVDIVTAHVYGNGSTADIIPQLAQKSREAADIYRKPFVIAEYGINYAKDDKEHDPDGAGTALHNSIWASAMLRSFGTAMNWWWDSYIRPRGLYPHYRALAAFLDGVDWDAKDVRPVRTGMIKYLPEAARPSPVSGDVTIATEDKWGKLLSNEFTINNNGEMDSSAMPNRFLHGMVKKDMRTDHIYKVDYPRDGKFILHVGMVSQGGDLRVYIDDKEVLRKDFPAGDGTGPWKKSLYLAKYKIYQCVYEEDVAVDVPAGKHSIRLSNEGKDWMGISEVRLTNYNDGSCANARCLGLAAGPDMLFWIQNKDSNWKNVLNKKEPVPVKGAFFDILDAADGKYSVEWWDTYKGVPVKKEDIQASGGVLRIILPELSKDVACKVRSAEGAKQ